jgi:hypothetical protein
MDRLRSRLIGQLKAKLDKARQTWTDVRCQKRLICVYPAAAAARGQAP